MGVVAYKKRGAKVDADVAVAKSFGANIPAATDRDGVCLAQVRTGAGVLILNGAGVVSGAYPCGFDGGRKITAYSAGDINTVTFTVTGTDHAGLVQTEDLTGVNNSTVTGAKYFKTVTSVTSDGTIGTNVEIGFAASLVVLNPSVASHFHLAHTNNEAVVLAIYGGNSGGFKDKISLKLTSPAAHTFAWANGTAPSDMRIYFAGGTEAVPTVAAVDWYEFEYDGAAASGDSIWYCTKVVADIKA